MTVYAPSGLICPKCGLLVRTLYGWGSMRCWTCFSTATEETP